MPEKIKRQRSTPRDAAKNKTDSTEPQNEQEITLNRNAAGDLWYLDPERRVVVLDENAIAERDRQQREPGTPIAAGTPRYARMMGHGEMPVAIGEIAPAGTDFGAEATPLSRVPGGSRSKGPEASRGRRSGEQSATLTVASHFQSLPQKFQELIAKMVASNPSGKWDSDLIGMSTRGVPMDDEEVRQYVAAARRHGQMIEAERSDRKINNTGPNTAPAGRNRERGSDARRNEVRQGPREGTKSFDAARADYHDFRAENGEVPAIERSAEGLSSQDRDRFETWLRDRKVPQAYIDRAFGRSANQERPAPHTEQPRQQNRNQERPDQRQNREQGESIQDRVSRFEEAYYNDRVGLEKAREAASEGLYGGQLHRFDGVLVKLPGINRTELKTIQDKDLRLNPNAKEERPAGASTAEAVRRGPSSAELEAHLSELRRRLEEM